MAQTNRLEGGLIDHDKVLDFTFNGKPFHGHPGDTLASALLANGQRLVGRSFKYHRPRGIFTAGSDEPNALVELGTGGKREPNTRATVTELFAGLGANSQNHRGSLDFDVMAINDYLSPFLSAGFYYKTFMWPKAFWEKIYEPIIRNSAGLGRASMQADPDTYDKGFLHCDLLVIGSGPSGLAAALAAGRAGLRVILADEDFQLGGRLNAETYEIDGQPCAGWVTSALAELNAVPDVRVMPRTTVYGVFDHGIYGAPRAQDRSPPPMEAPSRDRCFGGFMRSRRCSQPAPSSDRSPFPTMIARASCSRALFAPMPTALPRHRVGASPSSPIMTTAGERLQILPQRASTSLP